MVLAIWPSKPGLVSPNPLIKPTNKPTNKLTLDSLDCDSENETRDPALILINQQRSWILKKSWLHWVVNLLLPPERLTVWTGSHIYTTQIFIKQQCNFNGGNVLVKMWFEGLISIHTLQDWDWILYAAVCNPAVGPVSLPKCGLRGSTNWQTTTCANP